MAGLCEPSTLLELILLIIFFHLQVLIMSTCSGRLYGTFKGATPFPTDLPYDRLLREAVQLSNTIFRCEAQTATRTTSPPSSSTAAPSTSRCAPPAAETLVPELPLAPLTPSSCGSPAESSTKPSSTQADPLPPQEIAEALDALLAAIYNIRVAPGFSEDEGDESSDADGVSDHCNSSLDKDESYEAPAAGPSDGPAAAPGDAPAAGAKKRKRGRRGGGQSKKPAHNNGQGSTTHAERMHQAKKRRKTRRRGRADVADMPPY